MRKLPSCHAYFWLLTFDCLLLTAYFWLLIFDCLYWLLTFDCLLLTAYFWLLTFDCLLLTAYFWLLTFDCSLHATLTCDCLCSHACGVMLLNSRLRLLYIWYSTHQSMPPLRSTSFPLSWPPRLPRPIGCPRTRQPLQTSWSGVPAN